MAVGLGVGLSEALAEGVAVAVRELLVVIQDTRAGAWSWQIVDKVMTYGPRVQFKLNGTLTDPQLVDFIVKGF